MKEIKSVRIENMTVLDRVEFSVDGHLTLAGPCGSGKSTIINVLRSLADGNYKKIRDDLLSDGAEHGSVTIGIGDGVQCQLQVTKGSQKLTVVGRDPSDSSTDSQYIRGLAAGLTLNPDKFTLMKASERISLLGALIEDPEKVKEALIKVLPEDIDIPTTTDVVGLGVALVKCIKEKRVQAGRDRDSKYGKVNGLKEILPDFDAEIAGKDPDAIRTEIEALEAKNRHSLETRSKIEAAKEALLTAEESLRSTLVPDFEEKVWLEKLADMQAAAKANYENELRRIKTAFQTEYGNARTKWFGENAAAKELRKSAESAAETAKSTLSQLGEPAQLVDSSVLSEMYRRVIEEQAKKVEADRIGADIDRSSMEAEEASKRWQSLSDLISTVQTTIAEHTSAAIQGGSMRIDFVNGDPVIQVLNSHGSWVPFENLSSGEKLEASTRLAAQAAKDSKLILIDDAARLTEADRERVRSIADQHGCRVLMGVTQEGKGLEIKKGW